MQGRGSRLFNNLMNESRNDLKEKYAKRGRNKDLVANRNECLLYRYYYYSKLQKLRYDEVLELMGREFFLANRSITDIIMSKSESLKIVFKEKLSIQELEKKFNFLNWKINLQIKNNK